MRNLFLLLTCLLLFAAIKGTKKDKLEVLYIENTAITVNFNGKLFLPKTLPTLEKKVNTNVVVLMVNGKKFHYVKCYNQYCLINNISREIPVFAGTKVSSQIATKLFFTKEL